LNKNIVAIFAPVLHTTLRGGSCRWGVSGNGYIYKSSQNHVNNDIIAIVAPVLHTTLRGGSCRWGVLAIYIFLKKSAYKNEILKDC